MSNTSPLADLFPMATERGASLPLKIQVRGLGPIVSFKNSKVLIAKGPGGRPLPRPLLITKGEYKKQMQAITDAIESQSLCEFQTRFGETVTAPSLRSLIASSLPEDDSLNHIPEMHIYTERVEAGQEGVDITIERLP